MNKTLCNLKFNWIIFIKFYELNFFSISILGNLVLLLMLIISCARFQTLVYRLCSLLQEIESSIAGSLLSS